MRIVDYKRKAIRESYYNQIKASMKRGHVPPSYTLYELYDWALAQSVFHVLFDEWVDGGKKKKKKPSFDRLDDNVPYRLDNIQLMTWEENEQKAHDDMRVGKLKHGTKPQKEIEQYTMNFEIVASYVSSREASRVTGIGQGTIASCASEDGQLTAGGFRWRYVENGTFEEWTASFKSDTERRTMRKANKAVDMFSIDGIYLKTFPSMAIAAEAVGGNRGNISNCCKGKINKSSGYIWRYSDVN